MNDYHAFNELLVAYKNKESSFKGKPKERITFFDVTGYPHYENVVSNILKFLFDDKNEHCFGDLWLKSLIDAYNQKNDKMVRYSSLNVIDIKREYSNGSEKRIDLLIDARPLIVVIENKIHAPVYNPFEIYSDMAKNYIENQQICNTTIIKIVLSLAKEKLDKNNGFINITYNELFAHVNKNWQDYEPDEKWSLFATEFMNNLERKEGDMHMKMDKQWIDYVNESDESLFNLFNKMNNDINDRVAILRKINDEIGEIGSKKGVFNSKDSAYSSQFIDIKITDGTIICFETYLMKKKTNRKHEDFGKLYIAVWCRNNKCYSFDQILAAINKSNAKMESMISSANWGNHFILDEIPLYEEFSILEISSLIKKYVEKIAGHF